MTAFLRAASAVAAVAALALCALPPGAAAPEPKWPGFRGPSASGVADGQQLPLQWNAGPAATSRGQ